MVRPPFRLPIFPAVLTMGIITALVLLASCASQRRGGIRFCEGFDSGDQPVGEAATFSPGVLSMLVEMPNPVTTDSLIITVYRLEKGRREAYGQDARIPTGTAASSSLSSYRLDEVISFADTGRYAVTVHSLDHRSAAEGTVAIVQPR